MTKPLKQWKDLDHEYDACVLGNGASMAVSRKFGYVSLLAEAQKTGKVSDELKELFDEFDTVDFEYVLRVLWHAQLVNETFGESSTQASAAYRRVRDALVKTVRAVHCDYSEAEAFLEPIGRWLSGFRRVFSLNYDLVVYWALLRHRDGVGRNVMADCFSYGSFRHDDWESSGSDEDAILVFYPHGNLALITNVDGSEEKASAAGRRLLGRVTGRWQEGRALPLFVAEGTSEQKVRAIRRSAYLSTVYSEALAACGRSVVLHGLSLGSEYNDVHILSALKKSRVSRVAVSIFTNEGTIKKHRAQRDTAEGLLRKHLGEDVDIDFYDAQSEGCWTMA